MSKICCIYCIENKINGKKYIGQTKDFKRRKTDHIKNYKRENNDYLKKSIDKYGLENFRVFILEECSFDDLNEKEKIYISIYNTTDRDFGYNILKGGNQPPSFYGKKHSSKTKNIMSEKAKGNTHWLGKHHTQETKDKKSKLASGINHYFFGKKRKNSSSKYFGVTTHTDKRNGIKTYRAKISVNGRVIEIGASLSELECAEMYNEYVISKNLPNPLNKVG